MTIRPVRSKRQQLFFVGITVLGALGLLAYLGTQEYATPAAEKQATGPTFDPTRLTANEEITLGLKAAPELATQYGGLNATPEQKALVARVGQVLAAAEPVTKSGYQFTFELLAEPNILNVFTLPGGKIYITTGLLNRLRTEGELAAALAHAIAHGLTRDPLTQLAAGLQTGTAPGAVPEGLLVSQLLTLRYSPAQETAADKLTLTLMGQTGYSPNAMLGLLQVLSTAYYAGAKVEYFTTHPNPTTRVADIQAAITALYPEGVPAVMSK